jgi:7,8-dihydropterin-6-yl-methyl-4-(beta-D-ribofuranosyl)aminobenzene 5'-phosphate synthase
MTGGFSETRLDASRIDIEITLRMLYRFSVNEGNRMSRMKSTLYSRVRGAVLTGMWICVAVGATDAAANSITVVSSHQIGKSKAELAEKGGLSLFVKFDGEIILFDTGDESGPLLKNLEELGLDAAQIDAVAISHSQSERVDGELLELLSATEGKPKTFVPAQAIEAILQQNPDANVVAVAKPTRVLPDAWIVGPMQLETEGGASVEQALVLDQPDGLVVIVGCSFPGVASVVQQVKEVFGFRRIKLLVGGFHLHATSKKEIKEISLSLQQKGVKSLALSQCTGAAAMKVFRQEWGDRVVSLDFGKPVRF